MAEVSNIDELLSSQGGVKAPEIKEAEVDNHAEELESVELGSNEYEEPEEKAQDNADSAEEEEPEKPKKEMQELDDYGNPKGKPKLYTEEEVNAIMRDRNRRGKPIQPEPSEYQPQNTHVSDESGESWKQELEQFVESTVDRMTQKRMTKEQQQRELEAAEEFRDKFANGMSRFNDFEQVVGNQPMTDPMTLALRGIKDPSAFVYAASKRHPEELQRISKIPDKYAQMVEIGKLEERMRKTATLTKAPRPVGRTQDDGITLPKPKQKEETIEDLIAKSEAKRAAALNARRNGTSRR